ncbi:RuvB ATP-dependent DNA helicase pontin [Binucleata daphniae]
MSHTPSHIQLVINMLNNNTTSPKLISIHSKHINFITKNVPYTVSIYSTKNIQKALQFAIILKIKEIKNVYEGEITEIDANNITLRSLKSTKKIKIDAKLSDTIKNENLRIGDICYLESNGGIIKRLGRSEAFAQDCEVECEKYVPVPKNEVKRKKEIVQTIRFTDLQNSYGSATKKYNTDTQICIDNEKVNNDIQRVIKEYEKNGVCEVIKSVLIIYNIDLLTKQDYDTIKLENESGFCPHIIFVNDENKKIFDNCLHFKSELEVNKIQEYLVQQNVDLNGECIDFLTSIADKNGITYTKNIIRILKTYDTVNLSSINELIALLQ